MAVSWNASPFMNKQWRVNLNTVIPATEYFSRIGDKTEQFYPKLGEIRVENELRGGGIYKDLLCHDECRFRWVWNNSGADWLGRMAIRRRATQSITNLDSGAVNSATKAATFTANNEFGGVMYVFDNNDSAGAAPEGEYAVIIKNTAAIIYFQPDLSAALAANDDLTISYPAHGTAVSDTGLQPSEMLGWVPFMTADDGALLGIPDGYMGWLIEKGITEIRVDLTSSAVVTVGKGLITTATNDGYVGDGSSSALSLIVAYALGAATSDQGDGTTGKVVAFVDVSNKAFAASA